MHSNVYNYMTCMYSRQRLALADYSRYAEKTRIVRQRQTNVCVVPPLWPLYL